MYGNNSNGNGAAWARRFAALWAVLTIGLGLAAFPAEAQPFAYVANGGTDTVTVIDTAMHPPSMVTTVGVGMSPDGVAVTPNGKHVYVANATSNTVLVIGAATNMVVGLPIMVGVNPIGVAITPDGTQAYVTNFHDGTVSVINTATKMVVQTVPSGSGADAVAVTPDGTHVYVANFTADTVSVFARPGNTPVASIPVGDAPSGIAITPDGTHVYVANKRTNTVSVIRTATNAVVATIQVGTKPVAVAITPDGTHVYVANLGKIAETLELLRSRFNDIKKPKAT
jgi:YVTN family beta-propeller protein